MSFQMEHEDEDEDESYDEKKKKKKKKVKKDKLQSKPKKTKRKGGFGFGGMIPSHLQDDNEQDHNHENDKDEYESSRIEQKRKNIGKQPLGSFINVDDDDNHYIYNQQEKIPKNANKDESGNTSSTALSSSTSLYGKEAMEKLKAEQKAYNAQEHADANNRSTFGDDTETTTEKEKATNNNTAINRNNDQETFTSKLHQNQNVPLPPPPSTNAIPKPILPLPPPPSTKVIPKPTLPFNPSNDHNNDNNDDDGYIPFDNSKSKSYSHITAQIVNGDDALKYSNESLEEDSHDLHHDIGGTRDTKDLLSNNVLKDSTPIFQHQLDGTKDNEGMEDEMEEGGRKWEEEIARRAGVTTSKESMPTSTNVSSSTNYQESEQQQQQQLQDKLNSKEKRSTYISNIKDTIQTTINNLNQMELDLESSVGRRCNNEEIAEKDASEKENELKSIGFKFEYYQNLRMEMANWMGALRHLSERVCIVETALDGLYNDIAIKQELTWREWEDDVISILAEKDVLDYVVGRQPKINNSMQSELVEVDEFGRDMRSLESLGKVKRKEKRLRVRAESKDRRQMAVRIKNGRDNISSKEVEYEDSDLDISDNEIMEREDRRSALSDAVKLVLSEMDDDYSTPSKLITFFQSWRKESKEEYEQCYADLTLVELINVFARAEIMEKLDLPCVLYENGGKDRVDKSMHNFDCFLALKRTNYPKGRGSMEGNANVGYAETDMLHRLVGKGYCEAFISVLGSQNEFGAFYPISTKQTISLNRYYASLLCHTSTEKPPFLQKLGDTIVDYISTFIQNLAVPVLKQNSSNFMDGFDDCDDYFESILYSTVGQLCRLKKLIFNIIKWYHVLRGESERLRLAKLCLMDVISYRFLPVFYVSELPMNNLKSIDQSYHTYSEKMFIQEVWTMINDAGWLEVDELMLSTAALRAAAAKYEIKS